MSAEVRFRKTRERQWEDGDQYPSVSAAWEAYDSETGEIVGTYDPLDPVCDRVYGEPSWTSSLGSWRAACKRVRAADSS